MLSASFTDCGLFTPAASSSGSDQGSLMAKLETSFGFCLDNAAVSSSDNHGGVSQRLSTHGIANSMGESGSEPRETGGSAGA